MTEPSGRGASAAAGVAPKWAIFAPIFIPLFLRLDVAPQTVLAA